MLALNSSLLEQLRFEQDYYNKIIAIKFIAEEPQFPFIKRKLCNECPVHESKYECCKVQERFWGLVKLYVIKQYAQKMLDKINPLIE